MNGKFDKKKIIAQIEKNRQNARRLVEQAVKDAKKLLGARNLLGHESSPVAVIRLAKAYFRIEAQSLQAKSQVEQADKKMKAMAKAAKNGKGPCDGCQQKRDDRVKTPVA